ncbi:ABC transporter substrate-binding protein [Ktedonosporobacter rubrisoli]|uniref:ABC transporter substrate-binding protein n=2 Tax=Ktedonosporobacter rubrisoli TaxID=2509675 RepID=A0A4P6K6M7_KTERU|nr:ABC transporter substrate-binding protein [Ktedonosporobacter rubrisoli]
MGISSCDNPGSPAKPTNTMSLKVGQISTSVAYFPFYVADQQGFFKKEGLTIGPRPLLGTGAKVAAAVESGSIDIGGGVITDAFDMAIVDSTARVIGSLVNGYYVDVIASNSFLQQKRLTMSSSLADKVHALQDRKIGITGPGSGTEALLIYLFRQQGLDAKRDATLVNLGSNNLSAIAAMKAGHVDALSFFSPVGQQAEAEGIGTILISPIRGDVPALANDVHGAFYTKQSVIDNKKQAVQAFIRAIAQAESYIHEQQDKALVLMQKYLKLNQATTKAVFTAIGPVFAQSPQIDQRAYEVAAQFHVQAGLISAAISYDNIVAASTIKSSLAGL